MFPHLFCIYPEGISAISRWLSAATPPEHDPQETSASRRDASLAVAGIPSGCKTLFVTVTGGIASLSPRLMAAIPSGSKPRELVSDPILSPEATVKESLTVQTEGGRQVELRPDSVIKDSLTTAADNTGSESPRWNAPGGVAAISRWLSAATPPVRNRRMAPTPEGSQHDEAPGCDPCRGRFRNSSQSPSPGGNCQGILDSSNREQAVRNRHVGMTPAGSQKLIRETSRWHRLT